MSALSPEKAFESLGRKDAFEKNALAREDYSFNDRNATFCSFVTAHVKQASAEVLQSCNDYAYFWGITDECKAAVQKIAEYKPAELKDTDFALVQGDLKKFAAYDEDSTRQAALAFINQRDRLPMAWRKEAATKLLARGERFGVNFPEFVNQDLHKSAAMGYPTKETLEEALVCRFNECDNDALNAKLAEVIEPLIDDEQLRYDDAQVKIAMEALETYDAGTGLTSGYCKTIDFPEEIIGTTTRDLEKIAGYSKIAVDLSNGRTVNVEELSKEALAAVDPELAKLAQSDLIDVLPTLPKGDADLLARLA